MRTFIFSVGLVLVSAGSSAVHAFASVSTTAQSARASTQVHSASPPFSEKELITMACDYIDNGNGFYNPIDPDKHADDFVFRAGIIGPLNKVDYMDTMTKLGVHKAFDLNSNAFGHVVDPDDPMTVRFYVRYSGKQIQPWTIENTGYTFPMTTEPVQGPTESFVLKFNEDGKVKFFSVGLIGYGNPEEPSTGLFGAVFGLLVHVGAEAAINLATSSNVRSFSNAMSRTMMNFLGRENSPPLTMSEEVPSWFKGY